MPSFTAACAIAASAMAPFWFDVIAMRTLVRVPDGNARSSGDPARRALTSAPHGRAPVRAARHRAQMAGHLGARAHLGGSERGRWRPALVRARDAAVPLGRAPHGAPEELLGG